VTPVWASHITIGARPPAERIPLRSVVVPMSRAGAGQFFAGESLVLIHRWVYDVEEGV
jgi:hypothetical protein